MSNYVNEYLMQIKTMLENMMNSKINVGEYNKQLDEIFKLDNPEKEIEKLYMDVLKENEKYIIINTLAYAKSLRDINIETSKTKCKELLLNLSTLNYKIREENEDKIQEIYSYVYELMKKEINELNTYSIFMAVKNDNLASHYINKCILDECERLNSSVTKVEGLEKLNVLVNESKSKGNYSSVITKPILEQIVFVTMSDEKRERFTKAFEDLKKEIPEITKETQLKDYDSYDVSNAQSTIEKNRKYVNADKKVIRKRLIALGLSATLFSGAGYMIPKLVSKWFSHKEAWTTTETYIKGEEVKPPIESYKRMNKQEVTRYLDVYEKSRNLRDDLYIKRYDLTNVVLDADDSETYLDIDLEYYKLEASDGKYVNVENAKELYGRRIYTIETQDFSKVIDSVDVLSRNFVGAFLYIVLILLACIPYMPLNDIYVVIRRLLDIKDEKSAVNQAIKSLKDLFEKYKPVIKENEKLYSIYLNMISEDADKYVDSSLIKEVDEAVSVLEQSKNDLVKKLQVSNG